MKTRGWAFEFATKQEESQPVQNLSAKKQKTKEEKKEVTTESQLQEEAKEKIEESEIEIRNSKNREKYLKEGEYVYDLFAILVHSGSAYGGHYFAYIKDLKSNGWVSYSDTMVRPIRISEIQRVFGGHDSRSKNILLFCRKLT